MHSWAIVNANGAIPCSSSRAAELGTTECREPLAALARTLLTCLQRRLDDLWCMWQELLARGDGTIVDVANVDGLLVALER